MTTAIGGVFALGSVYLFFQQPKRSDPLPAAITPAAEQETNEARSESPDFIQDKVESHITNENWDKKFKEPSPKQITQAAPPQMAQQGNQNEAPNSKVSGYLNDADLAFKEGVDGCTWVGSAIDIANNPEYWGSTPQYQKNEIRGYAARCGLRF